MNESDLRKLLDAATPRPWTIMDFPDGMPPMRAIVTTKTPRRNVTSQVFGVDAEDAALIVAAVNELPRLLDRIEALEKALAPFAKVGAEWDLPDEPHPDITAPPSTREHSVVTPDDFRRAFAALGGSHA